MAWLHRGFIITMCLASVLVLGCSTYKTEFEDAKKQIAQLKSEKQLLTDETARLKQEKTDMGEQVSRLDEMRLKLETDVSRLKGTNEALSRENDRLGKSQSRLEKQIAQLKQDNSSLAKKVARLEKERDTAPKPVIGTPPSVEKRETAATPERAVRAPKASRTPCDAVIQFMHKSMDAIRRSKGDERKRLLAELKTVYAREMRGAPARAITNAEGWVNEASRTWDKASDDGLFQLLKKRNAVLKACGKTPEQGGF